MALYSSLHLFHFHFQFKICFLFSSSNFSVLVSLGRRLEVFYDSIFLFFFFSFLNALKLIHRQWKDKGFSNFILVLFQVLMKSGETPIQGGRHAQSRKVKQVSTSEDTYTLLLWTTPIQNTQTHKMTINFFETAECLLIFFGP